MQIDTRKVYFNAVLGGLGGLLGWAAGSILVSILFGGSGADRWWKLYIQQMVFGPAVGVLIGGAIGATDGLVISRSRERLERGVRYGVVAGAVGGFGLLLGELFFSLAGGGTWTRAIGWAMFGAFIGASDGYARKMPSNLRYGLFGGLLGGLVGGSAYDCMSAVLLRLSGDRALALALSASTGLVVLGACIGAGIGLVESLLRAAWFSIRGGPHEGETRTIDPQKDAATIGRSGRCDIVLARDNAMSDIHAVVRRDNHGLSIAPNGGPILLLDQGQFRPVDGRSLQDGDVIRVGSSRMHYFTSEKPQS